jgi:hypothetical protein
LPGVRVEDSPAVANRKCDISLWKEGDITILSARAKKRYYKHKSAIEDYFTTDASLDEISLRHHISEESLQKLIQKCLMRHEDGTPWGFRALLPRVNVVDHTPEDEAAHPGDDEAAHPGDDEALHHPPITCPPGRVVKPAMVAPTQEAQDAQEARSIGPLQADQSTHVLDESALYREVAAPSGEAEDEVVSYVSIAALDHPAHPGDDQAPDARPEQPATLGMMKGVPDDEPFIIPLLPATQAGWQALEDDTAKRETIRADSFMPELPFTPIPPALQDEAETAEEETPEEIPAQGVEDASNVGLEPSQDVPMNGGAKDLKDAPQAAHPGDDKAPLMAPTDALDPVDSLEEATAGEADNVSEVQWIVLPGPVGADLSQPTADLSASLKNPPVIAPHVNGKARLLLPIHARQRSLLPGKKVVQQRRLVRRRSIRSVQDQRRQKLSRGLISLVVAVGLLIGVGMPLGAAIAAYSAYSNVRGLAVDGVSHLLTVKSLLSFSKSDPFAALDAKKLQQAQSEFNKAESDFVQLQQLVNRPDIQSAIQQFAPEYSNSLGMAKSLVQVGLDISRMGSELSGVGIIGANILHGSPLATGSTKPLISVADVAAIEGAMMHALYYIDDIRLQMSQVSVKDLPVSDAQKRQLTAALALLPQARELIVQNQGLVEAGAWLLGVGQKRRFLVQTMDRAELRPGGGFTGQYGILEIENGRMAPFTLRDVALLDYAENGVELGRRPPPEYSWMNFGNWGLRDSNLSGDYPTTAQLNMRVFQEEGGGPIDGDIAFTTTFIGHIIDMTGPIKVQEYGETITSKNLEERLHYYQQDFSAIAVERQKTGDTGHAVRKAFTALLGKLLLDRVRHLPVKKLVDIAKGAVKDIESRDLEIYFANPLAEGWLVDHGFSGAMDTFKHEDGFMVVQANLSISKASQYVHTTLHDDITLDAQGGATHTLTITLDYKQTGPVYGFDTYKDYIRVYTPETAQFLGGDGFDTGQPLCKPASTGDGKGGKGGTGGNGGPGGTGGTGGTPPGEKVGCGQYKTFFPSDARYCPNGNYDLGVGYIADQGRFGALPIDNLGPPTELTSDLPGRSMWGGLTWTPKNCISYITLSWYVPHVVKNVAGQPPYEILVQKQSGYVPTVELNVDTSAIKGLKPLQYSGDLVADRLFPLPVVVKK